MDHTFYYTDSNFSISVVNGVLDMISNVAVEILNNNDESQELFDFIDSSVNGTIFHHPKFLSYHDKNKFPEPEYSITHFFFQHKNRIVGFLPGIIHHHNSSNTSFYSPYGASFGGLITDDLSFDKYDRMIDIILDHLVNTKGVTEINITPPTSIYMGQKMNDYLEYIYLSKGFEVKKAELTIVTRVSMNDDFPRRILKNRVKSSVNKCKRMGVVCKISENHHIAYSIIVKSQEKFNKKPTHSLTELNTISNLFPHYIINFIAYLEQTPIAVVTLILSNKRVANSFYIAHLEDYANLRPVEFLFDKVLKWLKECNYAYLDFGPSTFGYDPHRSLIFFKEGFGGKGIIKRFYQYSTKNS